MDLPTNGKVGISIRNSGVMDSRVETRTIAIEIRDHASGQMIVEVPLTADQLLGMLAGTQRGRQPAWIAPPELMARVGKQSMHTSVQMPRDINMPYRSESSISKLTDLPDDAAHWVMNTAADHDEWRLGNHNTGWVLHLTDYRNVGETYTVDVVAAALRPGDRILDWVSGDPSSEMTGVVVDAVNAPGKRRNYIEIEFEGGFSDQIAADSIASIERTVTEKEVI